MNIHAITKYHKYNGMDILNLADIRYIYLVFIDL